MHFHLPSFMTLWTKATSLSKTEITIYKTKLNSLKKWGRGVVEEWNTGTQIFNIDNLHPVPLYEEVKLSH